MDIAKCIFTYLLSLTTITAIFVYGMNLPTIVTGNTTLVKTYYYKHYASSFLLDIVLVAIYLGIANMVAEYFDIVSFLGKLWMVGFITGIISGSFYLYFITNPQTSDFFSKWFHAVKYKAVIYDILLVSSIFVFKTFLTSTLS